MKPQRSPSSQCPYTILGITPDVNWEAIRNAYKERARVCHPDKGGDKEQFQRVSDAFSILRKRFEEGDILKPRTLLGTPPATRATAFPGTPWVHNEPSFGRVPSAGSPGTWKPSGSAVYTPAHASASSGARGSTDQGTGQMRRGNSHSSCDVSYSNNSGSRLGASNLSRFAPNVEKTSVDLSDGRSCGATSLARRKEILAQREHRNLKQEETQQFTVHTILRVAPREPLVRDHSQTAGGGRSVSRLQKMREAEAAAMGEWDT